MRGRQERITDWERRTQVPSERAGVPAWLRGALAGGYFHSPAFRLAPLLRDHVRLRFSPRAGFERRQQPTLRILYFHRINDDNDPFLPSMSTAKFEEQIGLLAKHYNVVPLAEGMQRLREGGPPQPVLAVTFDDGYADNYTNALPILERYGIPATIFLTTGSVDSRQPMWFEELAVAVKKAPDRFVDVELDLPRRFPLQTVEERLEANAAIFGYLRTLSDRDRRLQLAVVLQRLKAGPADELTNRMLTWSQVREMRRRGIEFGGHTVTHPFLSRLCPGDAAWEVGECKRRIEDETQSAVNHFAYPNGREPDFELWNKEILTLAGYKAAVSTLWGTNFPGIDFMELRRGQPWELTLPLFAAKLDWYQLVDG